MYLLIAYTLYTFTCDYLRIASYCAITLLVFAKEDGQFFCRDNQLKSFHVLQSRVFLHFVANCNKNMRKMTQYSTSHKRE